MSEETLNKNRYAANKVHNYMLEPGDATRYRFGFQEFPVVEAYTLSDGVGNFGTGYVWFYINMPGGTGVGVVSTEQLLHYRKHADADYITNYLHSHGHGMEHVNFYTLRAVLLALSVLVGNPEAVELAAKAMLEARTHA